MYRYDDVNIYFRYKSASIYTDKLYITMRVCITDLYKFGCKLYILLTVSLINFREKIQIYIVPLYHTFSNHGKSVISKMVKISVEISLRLPIPTDFPGVTQLESFG